MKLHQLKSLLSAHPGKMFQFQLPGEVPAPVSFHITEVGLVTKTFIDCGGKTHSVSTCQLQAWVGPDVDHRIETAKLAGILEKSAAIVPNDFLEVEIEYEAPILSQFPVLDARITGDAVVLVLGTKHTDCLAKELCIVPSPGANGDACCASTGCC